MRYWSRFWANSPRQLRFTSSGRIVTAIALATGLAAINTGNNLLYIGWGVVLSAIVLSGVLSELAVRQLSVALGLPRDCRALEPTTIQLALTNLSKLASYGIQLEIIFAHEGEDHILRGPFIFHLGGRSQTVIKHRVVPGWRGLHSIPAVVISTLYPFGFFEKRRRILLPEQARFYAAPEAAPLSHEQVFTFQKLGNLAVSRRGLGDDFFALRDFQNGDDPRRIYLRRSLVRESPVVRENAWHNHRQVEIFLMPSEPEWFEEALKVFGSLTQKLLEQGLAVGATMPGYTIPPASGDAQLAAILRALARTEATLAMPYCIQDMNATRLCLSPGPEVPRGFTPVIVAREHAA